MKIRITRPEDDPPISELFDRALSELCLVEQLLDQQRQQRWIDLKGSTDGDREFMTGDLVTQFVSAVAMHESDCGRLPESSRWKVTAQFWNEWKSCFHDPSAIDDVAGHPCEIMTGADSRAALFDGESNILIVIKEPSGLRFIIPLGFRPSIQ